MVTNIRRIQILDNFIVYITLMMWKNINISILRRNRYIFTHNNAIRLLDIRKTGYILIYALTFTVGDRYKRYLAGNMIST